jgi:hydroxyethylthiazole kinase-like uncharacterized protein yjeF
MSETISYLSAKDAYDLDVELMTLPGYTLEQLMELAGLAVAQVIYEVITPSTSSSSSLDTNFKVRSKILLICGPGNNGGDGLVAARHLVQFGHDAVVVYPKRPTTPNHYTNLVQTCLDMDIPILYDMPDDLSSFDLIVDAIFGFSFRGNAPREPFASILTRMIGKDDDEQPSKKVIPIVSVDIPSGWDVDQGDIHGTGLLPDVLISLTAPKLCARTFSQGNGGERRQRRHFLAGRFLPPSLAKKYDLTNLPRYPGMSQFVEITNTMDIEETCNSN